ncbi:hypothetical protein ACRS6B_25840 [Nocardia asteroides]
MGSRQCDAAPEADAAAIGGGSREAELPDAGVLARRESVEYAGRPERLSG